MLCIPTTVVHESLETTPSKEVMLQWCARRYVVSSLISMVVSNHLFSLTKVIGFDTCAGPMLTQGSLIPRCFHAKLQSPA